ncbi:hypothetical protein EYF80_047421 [Liparis tanakae]|uniref:Uncharacterized protein n=1 Tax=Liparis tanakae TaxID=230148 RepID=A0A4Z2FMP1_9TELE|nr:hypothetical protein EYF80_047421 [Liparis tanakae]
MPHPATGRPPNPDVSQALASLFQPADPGQQRPESNRRAVGPRSRRNYICSAADSALSNPPAQTTPCYEFIRDCPVLHPFVSVSRVCRKPSFPMHRMARIVPLAFLPACSQLLLDPLLHLVEKTCPRMCENRGLVLAKCRRMYTAQGGEAKK